MIAINWGTSNFRAYKVDAAGSVEAARSSNRGAVSVQPGKFLETLMIEVGDWISAGESRVLMSGMVGSRNGWKEAPYLTVPATPEQIVNAIIRVEAPGVDARIVPGLKGADASGIPEVMRGEETEILGSECGRATHLCLPGTHTKWVRMQDSAVAAFSTSMTGDLYKAIREATILRSCTQNEPTDHEGFTAGLARSRQKGDLAHHLFGVRTLVLTGGLKEESASSYLSGLLIGHEVKGMVQERQKVHLIGDATLCEWYRVALCDYGAEPTVEPEGAALRGLLRIARSMAW